MMAVLRLPIIKFIIDGIYQIVSRHRHTISRWLPGGERLANAVDSLNDIETAAHGGGCEEEEECMLPDFDDE